MIRPIQKDRFLRENALATLGFKWIGEKNSADGLLTMHAAVASWKGRTISFVEQEYSQCLGAEQGDV